jgi:hypothetical protein
LIIVDNSGQHAVRGTEAFNIADQVIENEENVGFGAAINQGIERSRSPYVATLNDDAVAHPGWIGALLDAMEGGERIGMCASRVMLSGTGRLDSAGMLICGDGSSKQRGHGLDAAAFGEACPVLLPSGSAAIYRRAMLAEIGLFDEKFFLYCEDTDLGLRARRAGWQCVYTPRAVVEHVYSHSAGRASALKAYYVERNRLFVIVKNFPAGLLWKSPLVALTRYGWHVLSIFRGRGTAAEFRREGNSPLRLVWFVLRAHCAALAALPRLWRMRRAIRARSGMPVREFRRLLAAHSISAREVAAQ